MFRQIRPGDSAVEACAAQIRKAILRGTIAPGQRLPPERELAGAFGLSRLTVRAALAQLSAAGLIRARQGSGHTVLDYRSRGGPDLLVDLARLAAQPGALSAVAADLLLVRRQLARALLEKLDQRGDGADMAPVARAIDELERLARAGASSQALAAADLAVVAALATAAGGVVLGLCANPIARVLAELPRLRAAVYADPTANVAGFRALLALLAGRRSGWIEHALELLAGLDRLVVARLAPGGAA